MARRSGSVFQRKDDGSWWARLVYVDPRTGSRRDLQRRARNRTHARELRDALVHEYDAGDGRSLTHDRKTFADLADFFELHYVKTAEYRDGRKIAGYRALKSVESRMKVIRPHFAKRPLRTITYADPQGFRTARLQASTRTGSKRSIASVNREMELVRRMFNIAEREGWIIKSPFRLGDPLITHADERRRERILTADEEALAYSSPACIHVAGIYVH